MSKKTDKFDLIYNSYINGNISELKSLVKKLTKTEIISFIKYEFFVNGVSWKNAIETIELGLVA